VTLCMRCVVCLSSSWWVALTSRSAKTRTRAHVPAPKAEAASPPAFEVTLTTIDTDGEMMSLL
jgi:hypothetical protein